MSAELSPHVPDDNTNTLRGMPPNIIDLGDENAAAWIILNLRANAKRLREDDAICRWLASSPVQEQQQPHHESPTDTASQRRFVGVFTAAGRRWRAQIGMNGGVVHLGTFDTREAAARAYDQAVRHHGLTRSLNFPGETSSVTIPLCRPKPKKNFIGVSASGNNGWRAEVWCNGGKKYLGTFLTKNEAALVYDRYVRKNHLHKPLNFPDSNNDDGGGDDCSEHNDGDDTDDDEVFG